MTTAGVVKPGFRATRKTGQPELRREARRDGRDVATFFGGTLFIVKNGEFSAASRDCLAVNQALLPETEFLCQSWRASGSQLDA